MHTKSKTAWDCREAQVQIALKAGDDLDDPVALALLEAHLTNCDGCRRYLARMESTLEVLQTSALESPVIPRVPSVWSRVAHQLPQRSSYAQFNVWMPTTAMVAACAAMIFVTIVQIERSTPFDPMVSPHLETVFDTESGNSMTSDRQFAMRRPTNSLERSIPASVPVNFPADTGTFRMKFPPRSQPSSAEIRNW